MADRMHASKQSRLAAALALAMVVAVARAQIPVAFLAPGSVSPEIASPKPLKSLCAQWAPSPAEPHRSRSAWLAGMGSLLAVAAAATPRALRKADRGRRAACRAAAETVVGKCEKGGLDTVTLKNGDAEATIYLFGGLVASYKVGGHDWLAVRPDAKLDGSKPISGGLTHCFPQFGPGGIQQHGFARNLPWTLVEGASQNGVAVLELTDTAETRKMWPHSFRFTYWVELKDGSLDTTLRVENLSSESFDFTLALHSYYSCSKIDDLTIEGPFLGHSKVDKANDTITAATSDVIKIGEFTEQVYRDVLPGTCRLTDPAKGALEIISGGGWKDVVVWNPYGDEGMGYDGFVCCESAGLTPVTCAPKSSWDATMRLVARPK